MAWLEITIDTASEQIERIATALTAKGFSDLVIEDQTEFEEFLDQNRAYWDYIDEELEQKLQGVDSRHARKRGFAVTADHQIVRQVDAEHDRVLQHDHKKQPPERAVKAFISCQQHACPPSSFFGKSDTIIVSHPQDFVKGIC